MGSIHPNLKAFFKGYSIFILSSCAAFGLILVDSAADISQIIWPSLILAGFITAYTAPSFRIVLGIALAVPCAIGFGLESLAWETWYLHSKITPIEDFVLVLIMTLPYTLGSCTLGAVIGWAVRKINDSQLLAHISSVLSAPKHLLLTKQ